MFVQLDVLLSLPRVVLEELELVQRFIMLTCTGVQTRCVLLRLSLLCFRPSSRPCCRFVFFFFCVCFFCLFVLFCFLFFFLLYSLCWILDPTNHSSEVEAEAQLQRLLLGSSGGTNSKDYSPVGLGTSRPVNEKLRVFVRNGRSCMTGTATTKRATPRPSELCGIIPISGYCIATRAVGNDRSSGPSINLILNIHSAQFFSLF